MSLFGSEVRPSNQAARTEEKFTRARYNQLRDNFAPIENEILGTLGNQDHIKFGARDAGRAAGATTTAMQERGERDITRRGIGISTEDRAIMDRNNTHAQRTNTRRGQTMGEMAMINSDRQHTAGAVDAGNSLMKDALGQFRTASHIESQANSAQAGTRAGFLEKAAGVTNGIASGMTVAGPWGGAAGGTLAAATMF